MGSRPPLRQEWGPDVSSRPGPASEPLPPEEGGPWAHVLPIPPASFSAGELPQPQERPVVLVHADPGGEAAGGTGGTFGGRTGGLLGSAGHPVPDK